MPHELAINHQTGQAAHFYLRGEGTPWHGLGVAIDEAVTSRDAMRLAGQDFTVETLPLVAKTPGGTEIPIADRFAQVRSDTGDVLGLVSDKYKTVQNWEAYQFLDSLVSDGEVRYHTAGALRGGRAVWMLAKLPQTIRVKDSEDRVEEFLLFSNSHDGSSAVRCLFTPIRVVCANTLSMALARGERAGWTFHHTGDLDRKIAEARAALGLAHRFFTGFGERVDLLAGYRPTRAQLDGYFRALYPDPKKGDSATARSHRSALYGLFERGRGNDMPQVQGTLWAAYNAVTEHVDHEVGRDRRARLESAWWGDGAKLKSRALTLATDLATGRWEPEPAPAVSLAGVDQPAPPNGDGDDHDDDNWGESDLN